MFYKIIIILNNNYYCKNIKNDVRVTKNCNNTVTQTALFLLYFNQNKLV